ncbi:NUDIX hydrolase [Naumannella halotolerans]|uniref:NUDIX hydrolase n=1 Tax=Naumannella halotolerans TaxID=993414 RepID=UPI00370D9EC4
MIERPRKTRSAVRLIVLSDDDRVLLLQDSDPGIAEVTWWVTPGGGIDPGENELQTGVRELAEETGWQAAESDLIGPVARRRVVHGYSDEILDQHEAFYLIRTPAFTVDIAGHTPEEQLTLQGNRWWPRAELETTKAWIWPAELQQMISIGQTGGQPLELGLVTRESTVPVDD